MVTTWPNVSVFVEIGRPKEKERDMEMAVSLTALWSCQNTYNLCPLTLSYISWFMALENSHSNIK